MTRKILLFFRFAQEITITQHNKSKLFSASLNRNFPTDNTDFLDFFFFLIRYFLALLKNVLYG